jgi:hypothetical protein
MSIALQVVDSAESELEDSVPSLSIESPEQKMRTNPILKNSSVRLNYNGPNKK